MRELIDRDERGVLVAPEPDAVARGMSALVAPPRERRGSLYHDRTWTDVGREVLACFERVLGIVNAP